MNINKKICFIIPLYGKVPVYLKLFLKSVEFNKRYTFIFITDLDLNYKLSENVRNYYFSINEFRELIHNKTGVKPNFEKYYKIVDFKPAYGLIFQDYITEFDFWGMLDVDLILGEIDKFITPELLEKYDIISARRYWLSGSFALFKNSEKVNSLFKKSRDWKDVFSSSSLYRFCETGTIKNTSSTLLNELRKGVPITQIDGQIVSFTHILKDYRLLNDIKVHFDDLIKESIGKNMIIGYKDGKIFIYKKGNSSINQNKEYLHYHFVSEKSKVSFNYPNWDKVPEEFYITEFGFLFRTQLENILFIKVFRLAKNYAKLIFISLPTKILNKLKRF